MIMKKIFLLIATVFVTVILISSCKNSGTDKKSEKVTEEKEKIEIKYLEDFAQFENHEQVLDCFGAPNVISTEWYLAEGTERYLVSVVNPEQKNKIIIYWKPESGVYAEFAFVEASYSLYDTDWEFVDEEGKTYPTKTGLSVGDSISRLVELNGGPVGFYGLGWDYGGYVFGTDKKFDAYSVRLDLSDKYLATPEGTDAYMSIAGDGEFHSNDPKVKDIPLEVYSIIYTPE